MCKENKKIFLYLAAIGFFKVLLYLLLNNRYGFGRDEYYFIACADRLALGYIDHPPLIAFVAKIALLFKTHNVFILRAISALAGGLSVFLVGVLTKILGGKNRSCVIASLAFLAMPVFLRIHTKFSISVFENLLMCIFFIFLALLIKSRKTAFLVPLFSVAAVAFLFKYSILFWLGVMFWVAIFVKDYRFVFKSRYLYLGLVSFFVIVSPNVFWQYSHGFPIVASFKNIDAYHVQTISYFSFLLGQFFYLHPFGFLLITCGIIWFLSSCGRGWKYRIFAFMGVGVFLFLFLKKGKVYYTSPVFLPLIAGGSIYLEQIVKNKKNEIMVFVLFGVMFVTALPFSLPILSSNSYNKLVSAMLPDKVGSNYGVMDDFDERQGWQEIAMAVSETYLNMSYADKKKAYVFAASYGIAAVLQYYSKNYSMPPVISGNNNFMLWYDGKCNGEVVIMVGWQYHTVSKLFGEVNLVPQSDIDSFGRQIYLCKNILYDFNDVFENLKHIGVY